MATIYDIAAQAGVSVATVSAVVNKSAYVSPALCERVQQAITELHYHPNFVARSLAQKKTQTIGMLIPDISNPFYPQVVRGAEDKANEAGYTIILGNSDNRQDAERIYIELFLSRRVDGLLLMKASEEMNRPLLDRLLHSKLPVVLVGRDYPPLQADCVLADDVKGAYMAIRHLVKLGHRRIGIITGMPGVSTTEGRLAGYRQALEKSRIPFDPHLVAAGDYGQESGYIAGLELLKRKPTAVFVTNYLMTVGFMDAIQKKRLRCPDQIAVVSYDDFSWSQAFRPRLTCIEQPKYRLGYTGMELLLSRLKGRHKRTKLVVLDNKFHIRESCGAASWNHHPRARKTAAAPS